MEPDGNDGRIRVHHEQNHRHGEVRPDKQNDGRRNGQEGHSGNHQLMFHCRSDCNHTSAQQHKAERSNATVHAE